METKCDCPDIHKSTVVDAVSAAVRQSIKPPARVILIRHTIPVPTVRKISCYPKTLTNALKTGVILKTDVDRSDSLWDIEVYIDFCVSTYNS